MLSQHTTLTELNTFYNHIARLESFPRFWSKVALVGPDECWLWTASLDRHGYGRFWSGTKMVRAYRFAYESTFGLIPPGLELDHLCRVRKCVNPWHLEIVTCRDNILRGDGLTAQNAAKFQCPQGHPYDKQNTYNKRPKRNQSNGGRECRVCRRERRWNPLK